MADDGKRIDKVSKLFPASSHKVVERLLERAAEHEARQAGRDVKAATRQLANALGAGAPRGVGGLAGELAKAVMARGGTTGRASIRRAAPDTGGRPFHFAHSVVTKKERPKAASGVASGGTASRSAAHMRYIERDMAVERTRSADEPGRDGEREREVGVEAGRAAPGEGERGFGPEVGGAGTAHATGAAAGQGYVENSAKLANGEVSLSSFGTIGDTFAERVRFWEALEEAEAHPAARVQHRLIVELPHEASPAARHEMVRRFCERFEDDGVPYWAALHAPGARNDDRNFHAHIVYSERPARRMDDPARPGEPRWDFEVVRTSTSSSRHTRTSRPHRQNKLRAYSDRNFIKARRAEFAAIVNDVLARDRVRGIDGRPVSYDARSYKGMGLDVVPMRSINRIVADKVRNGQVSVLDAGYTKRMIAAELRDAAARRDKAVLDVVALDDALRAAAGGKRGAALAGLPPDMRPSPLSVASRPAMRGAADRLSAARHEALQVDVMERATVATLGRVIEATAPRDAARPGASRKAEVPARDAGAPDALALLHAAATEELAEARRTAREARRKASYKVGLAVRAWRALVGARALGDPVPARRPALDEREIASRPGAGVAGAGTGRAAVAAAHRTAASAIEPSTSVAGAKPSPTPRPPTRDPSTAIPPGGLAPASPGVSPSGRPSTGGAAGSKAGRGPIGAAGPEAVASATPSPAAPAGAAASTRRPPQPIPGLAVADLVAASMTVSGWLRNIRETVPPGEQFAAAQALVESLGQRAKARNAEWRRIQERIASGEIKPKPTTVALVVDGAAARDRTDGPAVVGGGGMAATPTSDGVPAGGTPPATGKVAAADPAKNRGAKTAPDASGDAEVRSLAAGVAPVAAAAPVTGDGVEGPSAADVAPGAAAAAAATARTRSDAAPPDAAATSPAVAPNGEGDADATEEGEPGADAERRRRRRAKEIEARRKKRKAVLGRQNKGKER